MSMKSTDDLVRIARSGGGLELDVGVRPTDDVVRIARAAGEGNARLHLSGVSLRPVDDLVRIGRAGGGSVVFRDA